MSFLINVTPTVHEKFKNYKDSSTFRNKTDCELLDYFLDSLEVITCIVELGARTTAAPRNNPTATTPVTTTRSAQQPFFSNFRPAAREPQLITPSTFTSRLRTARKSTTSQQNPTPTSRLNTTASCTPSPNVVARKNTPVQSARKTTPSSSKAKKSTSTSPATCTRTTNEPVVASITGREDVQAALEYAINWRASILNLKRSPRISPSSPTTRRKSTQNSAGSRKPPPLAISPMPSVKTEPVDPDNVIQQTIPVPLAAVLDKITAGPVPVINPPVTTPQTSRLESTDGVGNSGQGITTESCNPSISKKTLRLQSRPKRRKTLTEKARNSYHFNDPPTPASTPNYREVIDSSSSRPANLNKRPANKTIAQLLVEAAFHTPGSPSGTVPSTTTTSGATPSPSTSRTSTNVNPHGLLSTSSATDHSYSKTRRIIPESQTKSNKPFVLTIKPIRSPDIASAISSGEPICPQHPSYSLPPRSTSHATKSTAPADSSRSHSAAGKSGRNSYSAPLHQTMCSVCYRMFDTKADFERHIKTVSTSKEYDLLTHRRVTPLSTEPNLSDDSESTKFCGGCNTAFIDRKALKTHLADGCTIFPGLSRKNHTRPSTASNIEQALTRDTSNTQQRPGENVIRILNVSQIHSAQSRSSTQPNSVPPHRASLQRCQSETPVTPISKKRPQSDLFSLTCTDCNQKFCECLISSRKYKSNYQKKPAENLPKTDALNYPFPFDLDAVRAPDEKENTSNRANNVILFKFGDSNSVIPPVVSPPRSSEDVSAPQKSKLKEKEIIAIPKENGVEDPPPTKSFELLQQLEDAIGVRKTKPKLTLVKHKCSKSATLSFEETRLSEIQFPPKPKESIDQHSSLTSQKDNPMGPSSSVDNDENIVSETESFDETLDTDDECGFSVSENDQVPETDKVIDTVADLENIASSSLHEHPSKSSTKEDGMKPKRSHSKIMEDGNIDSDYEVGAADFVTDDELDLFPTDDRQQSSRDASVPFNNFDELLRCHILFDEKLALSQDEEYRNLCIAEDEDDFLSVSSGSDADFCFDSDDECSDGDPTMDTGEPTSKQVENESPVGTSEGMLAQPEVLHPGYRSRKSDVSSERSSKRLQAKAVSISFLGKMPRGKNLNDLQRWTRSKEKTPFCFPCDQHFASIDSLEMHELKHHSIA